MGKILWGVLVINPIFCLEKQIQEGHLCLKASGRVFFRKKKLDSFDFQSKVVEEIDDVVAVMYVYYCLWDLFLRISYPFNISYLGLSSVCFLVRYMDS